MEHKSFDDMKEQMIKNSFSNMSKIILKEMDEQGLSAEDVRKSIKGKMIKPLNEKDMRESMEFRNRSRGATFSKESMNHISTCCNKKIGEEEFILNHGMCNNCMDNGLEEANKRQKNK